MSVTGWKAPQTAANVDRDGKADWGFVDYAKADDGNYASCQPAKNDYGDWLRLTNFGFSTSDIPSGATINGIEVKYERYAGIGSTINDSVIKLRKTTGQVGDNKASAIYWSTSPEVVTYPASGGATDTWNSGLLDSDIRDSGFGVDLSPFNDYDFDVVSAFIDYCQIRVYYTVAGWANISTINGTASSSISKVDGIAVASISKVNGVAV